MALNCRAVAVRPAWAVLAVSIVVASLLGGFSAANPLVWQREALGEGEYWRLLSAHLVHLSPWHLLTNLLGLWLVTELLCETFTVAQWISLLFASALGVSLLLLLLQADLQWYAGLSGVLHGLWSGGAACRWVVERKKIFLLALLALFARLMMGRQISDEFLVIAEAHWYGAFSGLLWLVLTRMYERHPVFD